MAAALAVLKGAASAAGPELEASARLMGVLLPEEPEPELITVWQENWPAVRLFMAMQTQLRVSMHGVDGFDYAVLPLVERRLRLSPRQARDAFDGLRVMEQQLLRHHNKG